MADRPSRTPDKPAPEVSAPATAPRAGESTDPEVHRLLAELQTAEMNLAAARKPLQDLGYEV